MITVKTNIGQVAASLQNKFKLIRNEAYVNDKLIRTLAEDLVPMVADRIHGEGKKADGTQIGEYSNKYLSTRKRYNRGTDTKVIFSLTRNMQNDFSVVSTTKGYGLGFKNPLNIKKADWLENGRTAATVKAHQRVIGRKSDKARDRVYDSIAKLEDDISDGNGTPKKVKRLSKLREKYIKIQGKKVDVKSHQRAAVSGFGLVYGLTAEEKAKIQKSTDQFIKDVFG